MAYPTVQAGHPFARRQASVQHRLYPQSTCTFYQLVLLLLVDSLQHSSLSIYRRLSHDILISHCAPALMRKTYKDEIYEENGTGMYGHVCDFYVADRGERSCDLAMARLQSLFPSRQVTIESHARMRQCRLLRVLSAHMLVANLDRRTIATVVRGHLPPDQFI